MILKPNCKINIGLNVIERRADGYHNIETIFYPLDGLCDIAELEAAETDDITFLTEGLVIEGASEDNLVVRAYRLVKVRYGDRVGGVQVTLRKQIPMGAGLGGGSSDAAFMVMGLNLLFGLGMRVEEQERLAAQLGADCAFFVRNEPCFAEGIGDILQPIEVDLSGYSLVLVKPDVHVATAEAYRGVQVGRPAVSLRELIRLPIEQWQGRIKNDFEPTVFAAHPQIGAVKEKLLRFGAIYAAMSGSGASVYGLFKTGEEPTEEALRKAFPREFIYMEKVTVKG